MTVVTLPNPNLFVPRHKNKGELVAVLSLILLTATTPPLPPMPKLPSYKGWFLTYPQNETLKEVLMDKLKELNIEEAIVCREEHKEEGSHLHAFVKLNDAIKLKEAPQVFNLLDKTGNYQPAKSWNAVKEYVKKDGDFISHNIEVESAIQKKAKRNRQLLEEDIDTLLDQGLISTTQIHQLKRSRLAYEEMKQQPYEHDDVRGEWYYGPSGTGKSRKAYSENPNAYRKPQNKWFDGYSNQEVIILDDLDSTTLGHYLKIWADRYPCQGEVKCGTVNLRHKKFIVTSNWSIEELFKDEPKMIEPLQRRFKEIPFFTNCFIDPLDNDPFNSKCFIPSDQQLNFN